jgi:hypothetical protein
MDLLGVQGVGRHDNFFRLGGHSLLATQLAARIAAAFGVDIPLCTIIAAPDVAALAATIGAAIKDGDRPGR